jgi:predicted component of type VI protein secretion system
MGKDIDGCCEACRIADLGVAEVRDTPPLRAPQLWLTVSCGSRVLQEAPLPRGRTTIGRSKRCDVSITDGNLGRTQCYFDVDDSGVTISDANSTCGTVLDGHRIVRATYREGSVVMIADYQLRVAGR